MMLTAPSTAWARQQALQKQSRMHGIGMWRPLSSDRAAVVRSSSKDELKLVQQQKIDTSTTLFVFGTESETPTSSQQQEEPKPSSAPAREAELPSEAVHQAQPAESSSESPIEAAESTSQVAESAPETSNKTLNGTASKVDSFEAEQKLPQTPDSNGKIYNKESLSDFTVAELKNMCKENDVKGYSKMKKNELVDLLVGVLN